MTNTLIPKLPNDWTVLSSGTAINRNGGTWSGVRLTYPLTLCYQGKDKVFMSCREHHDFIWELFKDYKPEN